MEIRIEDIWTPPVPRVAADGQLPEASAPGPVDWKFLCERERVRAEDAEARFEELRWQVRARQRASSLYTVGKSNRAKLKAAREEIREVRRTAKRAVALEREAARLGRLLAEAGVSMHGSVPRSCPCAWRTPRFGSSSPWPSTGSPNGIGRLNSGTSNWPNRSSNWPDFLRRTHSCATRSGS